MTALLLACSCAAELLTRALDRWLLVMSQLFARVEEMLRLTVNSPVGLNDSTWRENYNTIECWNHDRMERQFSWPEQESLQLCQFDWAEKNWQVELRWGESTRVERSWEEKREMKRELRRVKKMCTEMKVVEKSWREVRSLWKSWEMVSPFATRGQKSATPTGKPCFLVLLVYLYWSVCGTCTIGFMTSTYIMYIYIYIIYIL